MIVARGLGSHKNNIALSGLGLASLTIYPPPVGNPPAALSSTAFFPSISPAHINPVIEVDPFDDEMLLLLLSFATRSDL